jgi:hypothetical protein
MGVPKDRVTQLRYSIREVDAARTRWEIRITSCMGLATLLLAVVSAFYARSGPSYVCLSAMALIILGPTVSMVIPLRRSTALRRFLAVTAMGHTPCLYDAIVTTWRGYLGLPAKLDPAFPALPGESTLDTIMRMMEQRPC